MDTRNIIDKYKNWAHEDIMTDQDAKRNNFGVLCVNIRYDLNLSTIVRNANAFAAKEVILYGRTHYDRRGAVGSYKYINIRKCPTFNDLHGIISDYDCIIGIDNVPGAIPIDDFVWEKEKKYLMCFGQEQVGLPPEVISLCQHVLYIRQMGSVRSLNVGCASAIAMYDYCRKVVQ